MLPTSRVFFLRGSGRREPPHYVATHCYARLSGSESWSTRDSATYQHDVARSENGTFRVHDTWKKLAADHDLEVECTKEAAFLIRKR